MGPVTDGLPLWGCSRAPACPRSRLTSPCFLILMNINRFCSVSALQLQGRDRKREKRAREWESQRDSEGERKRASDRKFLTADKREKEIQFTAQIGQECAARWWWLGPWLRCPYLCLPRHITTGCLHASQPPRFPEKYWIGALLHDCAFSSLWILHCNIMHP